MTCSNCYRPSTYDEIRLRGYSSIWYKKTLVSLNPIMIDGTGMCGGCRVTVGGQTKYACVDGPDFDGHEVDFNELMKRNSAYKEKESAAKDHICRMLGGAK